KRGDDAGLSRCTLQRASHTSKLAHPQQMCQRPLCFRQRDLCVHPADYSWHVAKTLDPLNFTYFQLCRQTSEVFHVSTCSTRTYVCVCVDFPEALFATIAAATSAIAVASRQRGRAIVAAAREAAVKNISFLSPLSIAHSRYRIYTM
ncbi:hypothetical protein ALC60_13069, partial [Trachymyrmex zeteki]